MIEVVIPAYNAARFLRETLESVAAQTRPPMRVTVVDDRSTDGTPELVEAVARDLAPRMDVRLLRNAGPQGPSGGRNTAIRATDAPHVALLDADDLLAPGHHARLLALLQAAPDAVLAFGDNTVFRDGETVVGSLLARSGVADLPAEEVTPGGLTLGERMFGELLRTGVFCTSACLFRRDAALAAGLFDEGMMYSEDQDFFVRLALRGRFVFTREVVTHKREHGDNLSHDRNTLRFCKGTAELLARLHLGGEGGGVPLSAAQRAVVEARLASGMRGYLYHASRAGFAAYWRAARLAWRAGHGATAARPHHLLRLMLHRFV